MQRPALSLILLVALTATGCAKDRLEAEPLDAGRDTTGDVADSASDAAHDGEPSDVTLDADSDADVPADVGPAVRTSEGLRVLIVFEQDGEASTQNTVGGGELNHQAPGDAVWLQGRNGVALVGGQHWFRSDRPLESLLALRERGEATYDLWIRPTPGQGGPAGILSILSLNQDDPPGLVLAQEGADLRLMLANVAETVSASNVLDGGPTHIAVTFRTGVVTIYVDGQAVASEDLGTDIDTVVGDVGGVVVGAADRGGQGPFVGELFQLGAYDRALTAAEIDAIFRAGSNPEPGAAPTSSVTVRAEEETVGATSSATFLVDGLAEGDQADFVTIGEVREVSVDNREVTLTASDGPMLRDSAVGVFLVADAQHTVGAIDGRAHTVVVREDPEVPRDELLLWLTASAAPYFVGEGVGTREWADRGPRGDNAVARGSLVFGRDDVGAHFDLGGSGGFQMRPGFADLSTLSVHMVLRLNEIEGPGALLTFSAANDTDVVSVGYDTLGRPTVEVDGELEFTNGVELEVGATNVLTISFRAGGASAFEVTILQTSPGGGGASTLSFEAAPRSVLRTLNFIGQRSFADPRNPLAAVYEVMVYDRELARVLPDDLHTVLGAQWGR